MADVEPSDLIALLQFPKEDDYRKKERVQLLLSVPNKKVGEIYSEVVKQIPSFKDEILKEGVLSALLGGIYGFCDRGLDPFDVKHSSIFKEIISEIEEAYKVVSDGKIDIDLWVFETFDYGIKKVYYLDWKLYLSQICY
jgi:hypothetical protein